MAYLDEWPEPGFPVLARVISSGATLRIELADEITRPLAEALRTIGGAWVDFTSEYVAEGGELVVVRPACNLLRLARRLPCRPARSCPPYLCPPGARTTCRAW